MSHTPERRQAVRRPIDRTGTVSFGGDGLACRVIDVSETGAQIRIDGQKSGRNLRGKRASLAMAADPDPTKPLEGSVVWVRAAVNGVYLGLDFRARDLETEGDDAPEIDE